MISHLPAAAYTLFSAIASVNASGGLIRADMESRREEEEGYLLIITAIDDEREETIEETAFSGEAEARAAYETFDLDFFDPEHPMMWHAKTLVRGTELLEFEEQ